MVSGAQERAHASTPPAYRVCLIWPEENPHAACFREVALLLVSSLLEMGYACDLAVNQLSPERINILLGYHLLRFEEGLKRFRYIPYQLEQLGSEGFPFTRDMETVLRNALEIWDFAPANRSFLKRLGLEIRLVLPGYHPNLERIPRLPMAERDVDVLFYGSIGERRRHILEALASRCRVKALFGVYGEARDQWISRARIVLNVHHYSRQLFEAVRVSYLLNNRCTVISEEGADVSYPRLGLACVPYEALAVTCLEALKDPGSLEALGERNYQAFKAWYPMTSSLGGVL